MDTLKRKKLFYTPILLFALLPLLLVACGQEKVKEHGKSVEISEYQERFVYEEWDVNTSGSVDKKELTSGFFKSIDTNDDNLVSNNEWENSKYYFTDNNYGTFNEWDINNNGRLGLDEFERHALKMNVLDYWDTNNDAQLSDKELSKGIFDTFDTDDDGRLDEEEYGTWEDNQPY